MTSRTRIDGLDMSVNGLVRALHHRGPDDQGKWMSADGRVGLVATRLAILDLSPSGHQPMRTMDRRYTIVFNGEIYNYRALRAELSARGCRFESNSDTEVVLHLYADKGEKMVNKLRGMFAFAIWDESERTCFLARDPLGIKPLYYFCDETRGMFVFASELRPLLQTGFVDKKLCPHGLSGFFRSGSVPEPYTMIAGVRCLEAGASLLWRDGKVLTERYWQPTFSSGRPGEDSRISKANAVLQTRSALFDSVSHHFVSDVPVGIFLSGGIDSTAVLALSHTLGKTGLQTFSISFDDPAFNEGDIAARTADHFGSCHTDCRLTAATALHLFDDFLSRLDQPSIDGYNTFIVSKLAHDHGLKVALSGLGGDELFGGYPTFRRVPQMVRWSRVLGLMGGCGLTARMLANNRRPQLRRVAEFLSESPTIRSAYRSYRGLYSEHEAVTLAAHFGEVSLKSAKDFHGEVSKHRLPEDEVALLELELYMRNQLLRDSDVMSMAWSLELRVPLVDRALVDSISRVPASFRLRPNKQLLLDAVPEVPEWVWNRPKRGFLFPFQQWLDNEWRERFKATVAFSPVPAQTWYQTWSLFVLEYWCNANSVAMAR